MASWSEMGSDEHAKIKAAIWFRRAADLHNSYGMTNLAQFIWDGRGGLPSDRPAAVSLWRHALYQDENPWAQLFLAEALERGDGVAQSTTEALSLYESAAIQDREPLAKRRASEALGRLRAR